MLWVPADAPRVNRWPGSWSRPPRPTVPDQSRLPASSPEDANWARPAARPDWSNVLPAGLSRAQAPRVPGKDERAPEEVLCLPRAGRRRSL